MNGLPKRIDDVKTVITENITEMDPAGLCRLFNDIKAMEAVLEADRIRVERELIGYLGLPPLDSQKTHKFSGWKVTLSSPCSYRMDWRKWQEIRETVPDKDRPTKWIETIDKNLLKRIRTDQPESYAVVAEALTVTPNKPGVTVEIL
jgi:hypothetical protein